jgi:probable HAF family extracellular repeat protein
MNMSLRIRFLLLVLALAAFQPAFSQSASRTSGPKRGLLLNELLIHRGSLAPAPRSGKPVPDAVAMGLAKAKVYKFSTTDYPGAEFSILIDSNGNTGVGVFILGATGPTTAFTVKGNVYRILDVPGSQSSAATAITTSGVIGGNYSDPSGKHGFVDNAGTFTNIDFPGAFATEISDLNDAGVIVGNYFASNQHGYVDNGGVFTPIDFPGAFFSSATGINSNGDIVGFWEDANGEHGFLLSGGVFTSLDFPFAADTLPFGINDYGAISGSYVDASGVAHGFIYSNGAWSKVDVVGAAATELRRIKNNGAITGLATDDHNESHGIRGR